jgi:hypothetical protein
MSDNISKPRRIIYIEIEGTCRECPYLSYEEETDNYPAEWSCNGNGHQIMRGKNISKLPPIPESCPLPKPNLADEMKKVLDGQKTLESSAKIS